MLWIGLIASLPFQGKVSQVLFLKAWEINAVTKRNDSNCAGILSDQGEAATASNFSEYTISRKRELLQVIKNSLKAIRY